MVRKVQAGQGGGWASEEAAVVGRRAWVISSYVLEAGLTAFAGELHMGSEGQRVRQQGRFVGFLLEQLCEWLVVPFVEIGIATEDLGFKSQTLFPTLSVRFIIHIKVEVMGRRGERNTWKLRRGSRQGG